MLNNNFQLHQNNTSEQDLQESLLIESIQINGIDVTYVERDTIDEDYLLGEDVSSSFTNSWIIEMYLENYEGFGGSDMMSKFGLEIPDELTLTVSSKRFTEVTNLPKPKEGDLIYFPLADALMEIGFMEDETNDNDFYHLGKTFKYQLRCTLFKFAQEKFETGNIDIDDIEDQTQEGDFDPFSSNSEIEAEADGIIDTSEPDSIFGNF